MTNGEYLKSKLTDRQLAEVMDGQLYKKNAIEEAWIVYNKLYPLNTCPSVADYQTWLGLQCNIEQWKKIIKESKEV